MVRSEAILPLDNYRYNDYSLVVSKSFPTSRHSLPVEDRTFVRLLKTADTLSLEVEQFLKASGLTAAQYNVLRILRGAEPEGLACGGIGERMVSHDPDITRLLDRMEKRGLITRQRQTDDRRVVKTRITRQGLDLLRSLDQPVHQLHKRQFSRLSPARLKILTSLLDQLGTGKRA